MITEKSLMKKFINLLMIAGKKNIAHKLFFAAGSQFLHLMQNSKNRSFRHTVFPVRRKDSTDQLQFGNPSFPTVPKEGNISPLGNKKKKALDECNKFLLHLHTAIKHVQPSLEGRKCRVAGTTKIVPAVISPERGCALAIRWIIQSARDKKKGSQLPLYQCLAQEFLDAYQRQGQPRLRRDECHKTCEGNRGFLRYRWW